MKRRIALPRLALLAAAAAGPWSGIAVSRGDDFVLKDGTTLEAQELRDLGDRLEVRTRAGRRVVLKEEIRSRTARKTPWENFEGYLASERPDDADALLRIGLWARDQGLPAEARRAFLRALAADPEHARAHVALGHTRVDGRWVVPPGDTPPPEETGEALPPSAPTPRETLLALGLTRRRTDRFLLESNHMDQPRLGRYLDTFERVRESVLSLLAEPPPVGERPSIHVLLADEDQYEKALRLLVLPDLATAAPSDEAAAQAAIYRRTRIAPAPGPQRVCVAWPASVNEIEDRAYLAHFVAHEVLRDATSPGVSLPPWIAEAVAYAVLNPVFPDDPAYCLAATGYGRPGGPPTAWRNTRTWPARARELAASQRAQDVATLNALDLNSLTFDALVQAWSLLEVLRARDPEATRALLRRVRRGTPFADALKDGFRLDFAGLDRLWHQEVLKAR